MSNQPDPVARKVAALLSAAGIPYQVTSDGMLHIPLPNDFGTLEIGGLDGGTDTICSLVDHEWHTHGDLFGPGDLDDQCAYLAQLVLGVFDGTYLLVEFFPRERASRKFIESDLEAFLESLEPGETYKVYNHPRTVY
jgi:hypothetical protein